MFKLRFALAVGAAVALFAVTSHAATIWTENFESGLGSWNSNVGTGTITAPPSAPPEDAGSTGSFVDADGATTRIGRAITTTAGATSVKLTWEMYSLSNTSSQRYYGQLSSGSAASPGTTGGTFARIAADNDATSKYHFLYSTGSTQTLVTTTTITAGWHKMQLTVTPGAAGVGSYVYQIDGNSPVSQTNTAAIIMPNNVQLGQSVSNGTAGGVDTSAWFDSLVVEQFAPAAGIATSPTPSNGATEVSTSQLLSWVGGANTTDYKVYLDTNPAPTTLVATQAGTSYNPGTLSDGTTYYWRVDARNLLGDPTTGTIWSFTTAAVPEPASAGLLLVAAAGALRRRK